MRSYLKAWYVDMQVYQKDMISIVMKLGPEAYVKASLRFEPLHFQFSDQSTIPGVNPI